MELLGFVVVNLDNNCHLTMDWLIKFLIRLNILKLKQVILHIVLITILEKSALIHKVLHPLKKILTFYNVIKLPKSVFNKNKNNYY